MSRVKPDGGNGIPNGHLFFCQVYFVKMIGLVYFCNCAILSSSHFLFVKFTLSKCQVSSPSCKIVDSTSQVLHGELHIAQSPTPHCQIIKLALGVLHCQLVNFSGFLFLPTYLVYLSIYKATYPPISRYQKENFWHLLLLLLQGNIKRKYFEKILDLQVLLLPKKY